MHMERDAQNLSLDSPVGRFGSNAARLCLPRSLPFCLPEPPCLPKPARLVRLLAVAFGVDTITAQSAPYAREDEMSEQTHSSTATHRLSRRPRRTPSADRRSSGRLTPPTRPEWRDELRAWMRAGGWTIERLSRQLDCATSTVCAWLYSPRRSGLPRRPSPDLEARLMELGGPRP